MEGGQKTVSKELAIGSNSQVAGTLETLGAAGAWDWFHDTSPVPQSLSKEQWTSWIAWAAYEHRNTAWKVAELIGFGMDKWSESYFSLVEMTGYERGYIEKIESWVKRGLPVTRNGLLRTDPDCAGVPQSWWEAVAPFKDNNGKSWGDYGCDQVQIVKNRQDAILTGWHYERAADGTWTRLETEAFKALCKKYRTVRGEVAEKPVPAVEGVPQVCPGEDYRDCGKPDSNTDGQDIIDSEFSGYGSESVPPTPKLSNQAGWKWFGNAGHLCVGSSCRFHLATLLPNGLLVSTVGEYWPESEIREMFAQHRGVVLEGIGDARADSYLRQLGYEAIGYNRLYETMVFKTEGVCKCGCGMPSIVPDEMDMAGYNTPVEATDGHMALCNQWCEWIEDKAEAGED